MDLAEKYVKKMNIDIDKEKFNINQLVKGINVEMEHENIVHGDFMKAADIAHDHLLENPKYYTMLSKMERKANNDVRDGPNEGKIFDVYSEPMPYVDYGMMNKIEVLPNTWPFKM